jgi:hypothetical protein
MNKDGDFGVAVDENSKQRLEQILKLDAAALLSTIRDLELKLSSYNRHDNNKSVSTEPPSWLTSLESRLESIEKWQQNVSLASPSTSTNDGLSSNHISESKLDGTSLLQNEHVMNILEQKVISKVKSEVKNDLTMKMENLSLKFSDQLLSNSLEVDRLHKLLMIRPTTSELQQIVLNVNTVEENTLNRISSIYSVLQGKIKDSVSSEMITLLDDLKTHQKHSNDKMESITKLINNYSNDIDLIKENEMKSFSVFQEAIQTNRLEIERSNDSLAALLKKEIDTAINQSIVSLSSSQSSSSESFKKEITQLSDRFDENRETLELQLSLHDEKYRNDLIKLRSDFLEISDSLRSSSSSYGALDNELSELKETFRIEINDFKKHKTSNEESQYKLKSSVNDLHSSLNDLTKMDLFNRFPKLEDGLGKLGQELARMESQLSSLKENDLKLLSEQIKKVEEHSSVTLPQKIGVESNRITSLKMEIDQLNNNSLILASRIAANEELVQNLLPLPNKIKNLAEKCEKFEVDMTSFKSLIESSIDANSEIVRRIEEMEEKFDGLDDIITSRMNSIRDTLMETLLEKQLHTNTNDVNPVQTPVSIVSDPISVAVVMKEALPATAKLTKMSSNVGKILLNTDNEQSPARYNAGVSSVVALSKKEQSYRRPTISGAMITGSSLSSSNTITCSVPSSTSSIHNNYPVSANHGAHIHSSYVPVSFQPQSHIPQTNLASMTDSFSTGSRTPRSHSNDEVFENRRESKGASSTKYSNRGIAEKNNLEGLSLSMEDHHQFVSPRGGGFQFDDNLDTNGPPSPSNNNGNDGLFESSLDGIGEGSKSIISDAPSQLTQQINRNTAIPETAAISPKETITNPKSDSNYGSSSSKKSTSVIFKKGQNKRFQSASSSQTHQEKLIIGNVGTSDATFPSSSSLSLGVFPSLINRGSPSSHHPAFFNNGGAGDRMLSLTQHSQDVSTIVDNGGFLFFSQCQFLADLCFNYEEISMKKKRISNVPSVICHNMLRITQKLAEDIAHSSDYEMVEMILNKIIDENIPSNISDIQYDEDYGIFLVSCLFHLFLIFLVFCLINSDIKKTIESNAMC